MSDTRCGFVALIGAPNAGKSTLLNSLVGAKVSIVSRKAQTTRSTVRGVVVEGAAQIVFVDTPGLFAPKRRLDRAMANAAWGAAADADALALLIDARQEIAATGKAAESNAALPRRVLSMDIGFVGGLWARSERMGGLESLSAISRRDHMRASCPSAVPARDIAFNGCER